LKIQAPARVGAFLFHNQDTKLGKFFRRAFASLLLNSPFNGMAHIHEKIDFTVAIFIVHDGKILLIHHRKLDKWLPLGGHIELDEDPEQAALREAKEESGLDVELLGERPPTTSPGTRALIAPRFLDIHRISDTHEHIGMIYWARPTNSAAVKLAMAEHHDIRWCSVEDLEKLSPPMTDAVKWYCRQAIEEIPRQP
jgi:8-oxo-dGTP pyrophosphatase MutT (NUDIX family)